MTQEYQHILVETTAAGVRTLTLNRPDKLNAVNPALAEELPSAINAASDDPAVRVLVLTGAGRGFCSGLDLDPAERAASTAQPRGRKERLDDLGWVGRLAVATTSCAKPVIAAINGVAAGAGFGLTLGADIRLMQADAFLTTGYLRRGLSPDAGVSYFLPRLIGLSRASELILTARDLRAEEAARIGLVHEVYAPEAFAAAVADYAAKLAAGPPLAQTLTKRLLVDSLDSDLLTQLRREIMLIARCFETEDVREAMRAFMERREPVFTGK